MKKMTMRVVVLCLGLFALIGCNVVSNQVEEKKEGQCRNH